MKIKIISGISYNKVIGRNNSLPWEGSYKEDMAYFRKMTTDSTVIMGRKTYDPGSRKPTTSSRGMNAS